MSAGEAASVLAFETLERELAAVGASETLLAWVARAAQDEREHARIAAEFAREAGSEPDAVIDHRKRAPRGAFEIALENAEVGCVDETFGALLATWQMTHARDARVREFFRRIARDESDHAALAWEMADALDSVLTNEQRAIVERRRAEALRALTARSYAPPAAWISELGVAEPEVFAALAEGFARSVERSSATNA